MTIEAKFYGPTTHRPSRVRIRVRVSHGEYSTRWYSRDYTHNNACLDAVQRWVADWNTGINPDDWRYIDFNSTDWRVAVGIDANTEYYTNGIFQDA